jgi:hypothetical protein
MTPHSLLRGSFLAIFILSGVACAAQDLNPPRRAVTLTLEGGVLYGPVDGYLQTPSGGESGTSSPHRPTLHELNIDDAVFYDASLRAQWRHLQLNGGAQIIDLSGSATLTESLVSHGVPFPAGTHVHADNSLNWYHVGTGWTFALADGRIELTPQVDVALLDFSYKLTSPDAGAKRSYSKGAVRLGGEGLWHFNPHLSVGLDGAASLPVSNTPQIATIRGIAQWNIVPHSRGLRPSLFVGGGAEWIDYQDSQTLPNHIHVNFGPLVTGGLKLSF